MANDQQTPPPPPGAEGNLVSDKEQNTWAMCVHLSTLLGFVGIPFANIIAPLVIWLLRKDTMPLVDDQGKEAINFQISITIYAIVSALLALVFIGFILLGALLIFDIAVTIIAAMKAQQGIAYRYPLAIRMI